MRKLVIASRSKLAGKTSMSVGIARACGKKIGYIKPLGEKLIYVKKRLWDYDAALMSKMFGLCEDPEDMCLGLRHKKLSFIDSPEAAKERMIEKLNQVCSDKEVVLVETGHDLAYGSSVFLDAFSVTGYLDAKLIFVLSGEDIDIMDDVFIIKKILEHQDVDFGGVIINKVEDVEDFKQSYVEKIEALGIKVLGVLPYEASLTHATVKYYSDQLAAKIVTGDTGMDGIVKNIFVGAMSANTFLHSDEAKEENSMMITAGDRTDLILAAFECKAACVILTNNVLPPPNIIQRAEDHKIPLLLVPLDTFATTKKIDDMEILITESDTGKIELLEQMVKQNVDLGSIID
ncbi:MAG TPA: DRTGG domain-containing protein [bacterium]|nr:DRTGG domain-containing protein [bacterium]